MRSMGGRAWITPAVVFVVVLGVTTHAKYSISGDEPHYLMVSESLLADRDIDLGNNYAAGSGARFGRPGLTAGPHIGVGRGGRSLPVHDIGLPVLLLPAYAAATRLAAVVPAEILAGVRSNPGRLAYSLIGLFLIGIVALAARALESALSAFLPVSAARTATLALFLAPPVLTTGFMVYPEVPALLATAGAVWLAYRRSDALRPGPVLVVVFGLGLLPWMHRKYLPFAAGLLFLIAWRHRARLPLLGWKALVPVLTCFLVPCAALLGWTHWTWGNWAGPLAVEQPFSLAAFRVGSLGLLLDRDCGLLTWAPLYLLLPAAVWESRREDWPLLVPLLFLFIPSAAHDQWWGGWSPAARFLVPIAPLAAVPLARLLARREARIVLAVVLLAQILLSAFAWQFPRAPWPREEMGHGALLALPVVGRFFAGLPVLPIPGSHAGPLLIGWGVLLITVALSFAWIKRSRLPDAPSGGRC